MTAAIEHPILQRAKKVSGEKKAKPIESSPERKSGLPQIVVGRLSTVVEATTYGQKRAIIAKTEEHIPTMAPGFFTFAADGSFWKKAKA